MEPGKDVASGEKDGGVSRTRSEKGLPRGREELCQVPKAGGRAECGGDAACRTDLGMAASLLSSLSTPKSPLRPPHGKQPPPAPARLAAPLPCFTASITTGDPIRELKKVLWKWKTWQMQGPEASGSCRNWGKCPEGPLERTLGTTSCGMAATRAERHPAVNTCFSLHILGSARAAAPGVSFWGPGCLQHQVLGSILVPVMVEVHSHPPARAHHVTTSKSQGRRTPLPRPGCGRTWLSCFHVSGTGKRGQ